MKLKNITLHQLAGKANISTGQLKDILTGKIKHGNDSAVKALLEALGYRVRQGGSV